MTMGFEVNAVWVEVDANSSAITGETLFGTHAIGNHRVTSE